MAKVSRKIRKKRVSKGPQISWGSYKLKLVACEVVWEEEPRYFIDIDKRKNQPKAPTLSAVVCRLSKLGLLRYVGGAKVPTDTAGQLRTASKLAGRQFGETFNKLPEDRWQAQWWKASYETRPKDVEAYRFYSYYLVG